MVLERDSRQDRYTSIVAFTLMNGTQCRNWGFAAIECNVTETDSADFYPLNYNYNWQGCFDSPLQLTTFNYVIIKSAMIQLCAGYTWILNT